MSRINSQGDQDLESIKYSELSVTDASETRRSNFLRQSSAFSNIASVYGKRPLSAQNSLVFPRTPVVVGSHHNVHNTGMTSQEIDESIFLWKSLNLSRAKLKASSRTSALLSGFAMVAMVEIQIDPTIPQGLLVAFAVCTVLLIAVHMLAVMISTCILPNVEAVSNLQIQTTSTVYESPHRKMSKIIELAWGFSTVLGILLFLVEIAILCWVKFYVFESHVVAWVATALLIPIICIFIAFAAHFYLKLVSHKSEVYEHNIKELELLKDQLDVENNGNLQEDGHTGSIKIV